MERASDNEYYIQSNCNACGKCINVCPEHCIEMTGSMLKIDPDRCIGCGSCCDTCPVGAVVLFD